MYAIGDAEIRAVRRVIASRQLFRYRGGEGGETDKFEAEFARKIGVRYATAMTSGTGALICGLAGMGIGPGDEVIVPAYTFMASALAAMAVGAVPVLAEVDESLTLDPADVEKKIGKYTKAVIPVHMLGFPCDMRAIMRIARRHKLMVMEDACQAVGGTYGENCLGAIGHAGAFSFNQFKIITCGEGGALVTRSKRIHHGALICHDGGCAFRKHAADLAVPMYAGLNFRISEIQSAMLREQLKRLGGILAALRKRKAAMVEVLRDAKGLRLNPVHDVAGECATTLAMMFESEAAMRRFIADAKAADVTVISPIDSGRHVYCNWEPVMNRRGAHHPKLNPFDMARRKIAYSKDMCPRTLDILGRTAIVLIDPQRPVSHARSVAKKLRKLAG